MEITYRKASEQDIDTLAALRIEVLSDANQLASDMDISYIKQATKEYYHEFFGRQLTYLAYSGEQLVSCGSACYYRLMPTYNNPQGDYAYIMNMYTKPDFRRQGIATHILDLLVEASLARGVKQIMLETTPMGKSVYFGYGFTHYDENLILHSPRLKDLLCEQLL